ncbi:L-threonine O-3-phosphate decarboxylase [Bradyrhizobium lablabi]|uniref:threonine-phosphate decarboxylase n=2 Tax=Bradyrhizobium lablabi TaxID=722472 RepID=A0A1M6SBV4_9BRAD|nr:L-threonine O-3-phosphate decarboxylase [Bradyrhizobium lablabi]
MKASSANMRDPEHLGSVSSLPITQPAAAEQISHGGNLDAARRRFPGAPEPWIDLSTGINPAPFPIPDLPAEIWSRLPMRSEEEELLAAAAMRYRVADPGMIVAAPGTQALIQLLPRFLPMSSVEILGPTYEEHEACWIRQGHRVSVVSDLDRSNRADVVIVVNPNNPTGRVIPSSALRTVAQALAKKNGLLVVDEAFVDVLPETASVVSDLPPATIVLRSFGKTYGLAGLRLGFAIADTSLASRIRAELGPWAVSGPALRIGKAALCNPHWLAATTTRLQSDQQRLDAMLEAAGFAVLGGTPLFRLARHFEAVKIVEHLGRHGVHVRAFSHEPQWLRFGLPGGEAAWNRLSTALLGA